MSIFVEPSSLQPGRPWPTGAPEQSDDPLDVIESLRSDTPEPTRTWPVVATLLVVLVEAAVLGFAAHSSGSAVLFAAAAQSLAGGGVELFLLIGMRRAVRPADDAHPMGYGREAFFWSLIASVGIFAGGGAVSISQGISAFDHTGGNDAYLLGYSALTLILVADLLTLAAAVRPLRRSVIVGRLGFRAGLRGTSDAGARTLIFDNAASVIGTLIAIAGLAVHQVTGDARADALAALLIGALLLATTVVLVQANRELLTDRAIAPEIVASMRERIARHDGVAGVPDLVAVYTGPHSVLVTGTVVLVPELDVAAVERALADVGESLAGGWPGELRVYLSPVPCSG